MASRLDDRLAGLLARVARRRHPVLRLLPRSVLKELMRPKAEQIRRERRLNGTRRTAD
jgi:hypothetical protein